MRFWAALMLAVALEGCSALGSQPDQSSPSTPLQRAVATHEYPTSSPPAQRAAARPGAPAQVISAFASAYVNWTADTVTGRMRALAALSIGQARAAMQLAAAHTAGDYELRRGGIANHGQVEAVAPLLARPNRYVVVTRESTSATLTTAYQGLRPAWHVTVATVTEMAPGRWVVSGWQPES